MKVYEVRDVLADLMNSRRISEREKTALACLASTAGFLAYADWSEAGARVWEVAQR